MHFPDRVIEETGRSRVIERCVPVGTCSLPLNNYGLLIDTIEVFALVSCLGTVSDINKTLSIMTTDIYQFP